jgi:cation-transporting ATPase 13A1
MSVALQVSTFAVNYRGRPFMESLWENKPLLYSLALSGGWIWILASGLMPDMSHQFELVIIPDQVWPSVPLPHYLPEYTNLQMRYMVLMILALDLLLCFVVDRVLNYVFGDVRAPPLPPPTASMKRCD